jgi:hypothetical protein
VLAETLENADPTLFVMCENAANDIKEKVAQLLDTQISAMLQDIVLEINRVAPKPLDLVAAPLKNALPVIKVCFEFLLSPKYTLDALAEIISTRAKIEELDPLQNLPQIDQLLEQQETIAFVICLVAVLLVSFLQITNSELNKNLPFLFLVGARKHKVYLGDTLAMLESFSVS